MSWRHGVRRAAQRFGVDIVRYPLADPMARTAQLLKHYRIDCAVDVGANDGGFANAIRRLGYDGRIVSFEPISSAFEALHRTAQRDGNWDTVRCAVGDHEREVTINISGNSGLSSSVLPMLGTHLDVAPKSRYVASETVRQERLDVILPKMGIGPHNRVFLKIDVQGYEGAVLDGAADLFSATNVVGLQLELSLQPLYEGSIGYREAIDRVESMGYTLVGLSPVFANPTSGELLQVDAVFFAIDRS